MGLSFSARCRCVLQGGPKTGATMFDCPYLQTAWTNSRHYRHTSTSYSFATEYRCCSELGRVVLNTCIPPELFTLEFACDVNVLGVKQIIRTRVQCSSCCERGSTEMAAGARRATVVQLARADSHCVVSGTQLALPIYLDDNEVLSTACRRLAVL